MREGRGKRPVVSIDEIPSLDELIAASRPLFFRGYVNRSLVGTDRGAPLDDIKDLSLNDWYGHGVLVGLGVEKALPNNPAAMTYASKGACANQYLQGIRDGRKINAGEALRRRGAFEAAEAETDQEPAS